MRIRRLVAIVLVVASVVVLATCSTLLTESEVWRDVCYERCSEIQFAISDVPVRLELFQKKSGFLPGSAGYYTVECPPFAARTEVITEFPDDLSNLVSDLRLFEIERLVKAE